MSQDEIRKYVKGISACYGSIGLTLSVVFRDEVIMAEGFGVRDLGTQMPVTQDTAFSIGSTTKAFTGVLAAMMVGEGKLDWDTPVRSYIPEFRLENDFADQRASTRDLLAHRVGMPRNDFLWLSNPQVTREEMIPRLRYLPNDRDFRTEWEYNNWMVFMGGYLAAKVAGQTWEEMVVQRLFQPLNMTRTTTGIHEALGLGNVASCYAATSTGPQAYPEDVNKIIDLLAPAGAIHSTAVDMARWLMFQLRGGKTEAGEQIVGPIPFRECRLRQFAGARTTPNGVTETYFPASFFSIDWGFGWVSGAYRGRTSMAHTGSTMGQTTMVYFLPDEGVGIFMSGNNPATDIKVEQFVVAFATDAVLGLEPWLDVANSCDFPCSFVPCDKTTTMTAAEKRPHRAALDHLFRLQELRDQIPESAAPREALEEYVGTYYDPGYDTVTVSLTVNNTLYIVFNDIRGPLVTVAGQGDTLFALPEYWYNLILPLSPVPFQRNPEGQIVSLLLALEPLAPTTFIKQ